jgi:dTDP-4-dehydrorhamnose 3,5-epimerase
MGKEMTSISSGIEGVVIQPLKIIDDDRGAVLHMLRADSPLFSKFGEVYFSEVFPGVIKAWKRHKKMIQLFAVPIGQIDLVIYDDRPDSATKGKQVVLRMGRDNYQLVKIPPRLWYGFKCTSPFPSLIANCADMPHDPEESEALDPNDPAIPHTW